MSLRAGFIEVFPWTGRKGPPKVAATQTIPVGETAFAKGGAEGATGPGNSQANGPQEDGSLESGAASQEGAAHRRSKPDVSGESFRSPDRGGRKRRSFALRNATLTEIFLTDMTCRPSQAHAALRAASRARRATRALRRLRDAGAVPDRHPGRARPDAEPWPACSTSRTWARCGSPPSRDRTRPRRSRPWCPATSRACSPASSATPSSPTTPRGMLDDSMVTSTGDHLLLVLNAACKDADLATSAEASVVDLRDRTDVLARASGASGAAGGASAGAAGAAGRDDEVHDRRLLRDRRRALLRHALGLHRR